MDTERVKSRVTFEQVTGDVLDQHSDYAVCHQCNCLTIKSHGLSAAVARKWPWADVYTKRIRKTANTTSNPSRLGSIDVVVDVDDDTSNTKVVCMYAQWAPGKASDHTGYKWHHKYPPTPTKNDDTKAARLKHFESCCRLIDSDQNITHIAVPYQIGSGMAGGSWKAYKQILQKTMLHTNVRICKLEIA
jgi:hypothetical protein